MRMFQLFLKQSLRSKEIAICLFLVFGLAMLSIAIGHKLLKQQQEEITEVDNHQKEHFARQMRLHNKDLGLMLYYTKFAFVHSLNPLRGLSIGQSDLNPTVKQLTIKTFEAQRFDTDLVNPISLHAGNLDLAFVIVFLFPLLIIVLTYNLVSEEMETGAWILVVIQAKSSLGFILSKLFVRIVMLLLLLFFLLITAKIAFQIPFSTAFLTVIVLSTLYIVFWFALAFLVACHKQSSGFNALLLLTLWLVFLILLPAGINAYITSTYPIPEALSTAIAQRDGYHTKWDTDKQATIKKFYQHYPQFESYGYPTEGFNWLWYYAMQQMGDDDSAIQQKALAKKISQRENITTLISKWIPPLHLQLTLNQLAGTSMHQHMQYLEEAEAFHEHLRLFFYPKVFEKHHADTIDWSLIKPKKYLTQTNYSFINTILPLLFAPSLLVLIALPVIRKL